MRRGFYGEIQKLGPLPESEMAETRLFESLPEQMTYPAITAAIMAYWGKKYSASRIDARLNRY